MSETHANFKWRDKSSTLNLDGYNAGDSKLYTCIQSISKFGYH